jgi:NAD+ synthase (glutamine-hydrolysing)
MGVMGTRREMLATRSGDNQCTLAYVNSVGANDGLIFDGGGFVFQNGRPMLEAERWVEGWSSAVVDLDRTVRLRTESTTWRTDCIEARESGAKRPTHISLDGAGADRSMLRYPGPAQRQLLPAVAGVGPQRAGGVLRRPPRRPLASASATIFEKTRAFKGIWASRCRVGATRS